MTTSDHTTLAATNGRVTPENPPSPPAEAASLRRPLLQYRTLAWATGCWLLLLCAEMIAKYGFGIHTPSWIPVVHGWVYFAYLIATTNLAVKVRWSMMRTIGTLLAGTVPLLSFFVEHRNARDVKKRFPSS